MKFLNRYLAISCLALAVACGGKEEKKEQITVGEQGTLNSVEEPEGSESGEASADPVLAEDGVVEIQITANDQMQYSTKEIRVKAGQKIRLTLKHVGQLPESAMGHTWVLLKQGTDITDFAQEAATAAPDYIPSGGAQIIAHTEMIGGGEQTTIEFEAPPAGTYDFICSFPGHWVMMQGKFIVEE